MQLTSDNANDHLRRDDAFRYLTARPANDVVAATRQQVTQAWWATRRDAFSLFVSELVLEAAAEGNPEAAARRLGVAAALPLVNVTELALRLAPELQALHDFPHAPAPMPCTSRWPPCTGSLT